MSPSFLDPRTRDRPKNLDECPPRKAAVCKRGWATSFRGSEAGGLSAAFADGLVYFDA